MKRLLMPVLLGLLWAGVPDLARAQSAENVAVIINDLDQASVRVGDYYVQKRNVPAANVIRIKTSTEETVDRSVFEKTIQAPIANAIARERLQDRILYLVIAKGVPVRIAGTTGPEGTAASVDSELTLLYRRMLGDAVLTRGRIDNPYYLGIQDVRSARPFGHREHDIFLVSRLDGFTVDDVMALIDRAIAPTSEGHIVLDQRATPASKVGDDWLSAAAERLVAMQQDDRVVLETTSKPVINATAVLGYYSWGSTDPQHRVRASKIGFVPGAIAATFVSSDARTFREPPANWVPDGNAANRANLFAGSAHSLIGDLIRDGVTGVAGHVAEPYLQSVVRPDLLFAVYLAGHNLIESVLSGVASPELAGGDRW